MVDTVAAPQASLTTRVNALVVLSAMLYAAGTLSAALLLSATLTHVAHLKDIGRSTLYIATSRSVPNMTLVE